MRSGLDDQPAGLDADSLHVLRQRPLQEADGGRVQQQAKRRRRKALATDRKFIYIYTELSTRSTVVDPHISADP